MNCEMIQDMLTSYLLGDLDAVTAADVRLHVANCEACQAVVEDLRPTLDLLRDALAGTAPAPQHLSVARKLRVLESADNSGLRLIRWFDRHTLVRLASVAAVVMILAVGLISIMMPRLGHNRSRAMMAEQTISVLYNKESAAVGSGSVGAYDGGWGVYGESYFVPSEDSGRIRGGMAEIAARSPEPVVTDGGLKSQARESVSSADKPMSDFRQSFVRARPPPQYKPEEEKITTLHDSISKSELVRMKKRTDDDLRHAGDEGKSDKSVSRGTEVLAKKKNGKPGSALGNVYGSAARPEAPPATAVTAPSTKAKSIDEVVLAGKGFSGETELSSSLLPPADVAHPIELAVDFDRAGVEVDRKAVSTGGGKGSGTGGGHAYGGKASSLPQSGARRDELKKDATSELDKNTEDVLKAPQFKPAGVNPFVKTVKQPFSTFSIDVDTASYTVMRNYLSQGRLPPPESVRTEEFVNFFDYAYTAPTHETFRVYNECAPSKFGHGLHLLKIGVKGRRLGREEQRPAVLTFLVDTSGSMNQKDRMELAKKSLRLLIEKLSPQDRVAIIQFDSHARIVLDGTPASDTKRILAALDQVQCNGSTNLEEGMGLAYKMAAKLYTAGAENRVMILSDGVANMGASEAESILSSVAQYRAQGIFCSVLGFGMGTYDDVMLKTLAAKGDGTYNFIDSEDEARRVFVDDLAATLNTIARNVKIQVEFGTNTVARYRQIGYEIRQLSKEDFRNDAVDAGEVGSGQSVTALYELDLSPAGKTSGDLRRDRGQIGVVRIRYQRVDTGKIEEIEQPIPLATVYPRFDDAPARYRLAACAAEYAEILRGSPFAQGSDYKDVAEVLRPVALELKLDKQIQELLRMVESAGSMAR